MARRGCRAVTLPVQGAAARCPLLSRVATPLTAATLTLKARLELGARQLKPGKLWVSASGSCEEA